MATIRTSGALAVRLVVQAATILVVARALGPASFGAFAAAAALATLLGALATSGTHLVLMRAVAVDPAARERVLAYALPTTLLAGTALLFVYLASSGVLLGRQVALYSLAAIGISEFIALPLVVLCSSELVALGRPAASQFLSTLPLGLRLLAAAAVFATRPARPLEWYAGGYLLASAGALLLARIVFSRPWPSASRWRLPRWLEIREALGFAVVSATANGPSEIDKSVASRLLPPGVAGLYAAASRIVGAATLPVIAVMLSALPRLFRHGASDPRGGRHLVAIIAGATFAYGVVMVSAVALAAPLLARAFGGGYGSLDAMLYWFLPIIPAMVLRLACGSILMALGHAWHRAALEGTGMIAIFTLAPFAVATFGHAGMPWAVACAEWSMAVGGVALISRLLLRRPSAVSGHA